MKVISDLHIHGRHSQATSKDLTIPNLEKYGKMKGLNLIGTGDFTHPKWIEHLKENLTDDGSGILKTKTGFPFMLTTEISLIYSQGGKGRRIHNVVFAPNLDVVSQITEYLLTKGRIDYDGRPIFKIPCPEFVESLRKISPDIEVIPAHIWTPWFSVFGSKSGFDSFKECFQDQVKHINAYETGLSSDPPMNWRIKELDNYAMLSFSDLHSFWPWRIGREATVFDVKEITYKNILDRIRNNEVDSTIEFWPEEGKYHFDGHRNCGVVLDPKDSMKTKGMCPKCGKPLTIGVAYRVEELADREVGFKPESAKPYVNLIPLSELISGAVGSAVATQKVWKMYTPLIEKFNDELNILLRVPKEELEKVVPEKIADMIIRNRNMEIKVKPGYDGVYGEPIFEGNETVETTKVSDETIKQFKPKVEQKGINDFF